MAIPLTKEQQHAIDSTGATSPIWHLANDVEGRL
jgi:hypothetical protein